MVSCISIWILPKVIVILYNSPVAIQAARSASACPGSTNTKHCSFVPQRCLTQDWLGNTAARMNPAKDPKCVTIEAYPIGPTPRAQILVHVTLKIKGSCPIQRMPAQMFIGAINENNDIIGMLGNGLTSVLRSFCTEDHETVINNLIDWGALIYNRKGCDVPANPSEGWVVFVDEYLLRLELNNQDFVLCFWWSPSSQLKTQRFKMSFFAEVMYQQTGRSLWVDQQQIISTYSMEPSCQLGIAEKCPFIATTQSPWYNFGIVNPANVPTPFHCHNEPALSLPSSHLQFAPTTTIATTTVATTTPATTIGTTIATTAKRPPIVIRPPSEPPVIIQPTQAPRPPTPSPEKVKEQNEKKKEEIKQLFQECDGFKRCVGPAPRILGPERIKVNKAKDPCVEEQNCQFFIAYGLNKYKNFTPGEDELILQMSGKSSVWIAMGFSDDRCMGKDFVVECVNHQDQIWIFASWNGRKIPNEFNKRLPEKEYKKHVKLIEGFSFEGKIYCTFALKKTVIYNKTRFDFDRKPYYGLMANGITHHNAKFGPGGNLMEHKDAFVTLQKHVFAAKFGPDETQQDLIFWHGYIMYFIWIVIVPNSIFMAKFYKETFTQIRLCKRHKLWYLVHVSTSIIGLILLLGGHFVLSEANSDWNPVITTNNTHMWFSIIAASSYFFNCFTGIFTNARSVRLMICSCNMVHTIIGHFSYISALGALYSATGVLYSYLPCTLNYVVIAWIVFYFVYMLVLTYHTLWINFMFKLIFGHLIITEKIESEYRRLEKKYRGNVDAPGVHVRKIFLIIFVMVSSLMFAIAIYLMKATPKDQTCLTLGHLGIEGLAEEVYIQPPEPEDCNKISLS